MDTYVCIAFGGLISMIVSMLKRIRFIEDNPKLVALCFSTLVAVAKEVYTLRSGNILVQPSLQLITCISVIFASSVATHESITHTIQEHLDL